ncbi:MAG TPA: DUF3054 domain-containing protein [Acidimicrobiia bacterium]
MDDERDPARDRLPRPWIALVGDVAVLVVFVLVGRRSHHEDAGLAGFLRVWWPFAVALGVAWLVAGLWRLPLAWSRAIAAWLITVALGMALRIAVQGRDFKVAFTIVTLLFVGAGMLGWRAVVRGRRARAHSPASGESPKRRD